MDIIYFGHRGYYRHTPYDGESYKDADYIYQFGYVFGRDAIVVPAPEIYGQVFLENDFAMSYNVFFLPTATTIKRFGEEIRLSAGWWASVIPPYDDAQWDGSCWIRPEIKQGQTIGETLQRCYNCGAEVKSEIEAIRDGDNIGITKPFVCTYCGGKL